MIPKKCSFPALAAAIAGLLLAACAETQPSRFYTLSSLSDAAAAAPSAASSELAVGVGPISLPNYLDRPEMVRRATPNEFQLAQFDRWGEPLGDVFPRVMAENLSVLLVTDRVFLLPRRRATTLDYQVEVQVTRFDADVGGPAVLGARWEIFDNDGKSLVVDRSTFTETVGGEDYGAVATAMSRTVAALSREIASAITSLPHQR
jgi:hypothetical protein